MLGLCWINLHDNGFCVKRNHWGAQRSELVVHSWSQSRERAPSFKMFKLPESLHVDRNRILFRNAITEINTIENINIHCSLAPFVQQVQTIVATWIPRLRNNQIWRITAEQRQHSKCYKNIGTTANILLIWIVVIRNLVHRFCWSVLLQSCFCFRWRKPLTVGISYVHSLRTTRYGELNLAKLYHVFKVPCVYSM